ncbi:MAG TPA: hypothetical protein VFN68_01500 [Acidimicrobiales bacterium]|nr:hypothetical protein [Acidimicrobiales bacterium]
MATVDTIAEARRRYRDSAKSRWDWMLYVQTVESLRRQGGGSAEPAPER